MAGGEHPDDLVTLTTTATEFEANLLVAVLKEVGIEAFAFGAMQGTLAIEAKFLCVPVQVRRADLERARQTLAQNVADSVDLDWDDVDVGQREDDLLLKSRGAMPLLIRLGLFIALLIIAGVLMGVLGAFAFDVLFQE